MMVGFACLAVSQLILIIAPTQSYLLVLISTLIEACSYATVSTQIDRMTVVTVAPEERARIMSLLALSVLIITTPFGLIAGRLSEINRILPFILDILFYTMGIVLVFLAARYTHKNEAVEEPQATEPVNA
jgi:MFS family permease